ncbi:MAG: hypothetical protein KM310_10845 [Clostridiales bacterium]|nr:hypothetical protein [Clostridiales bacterium]
MVQWIAWIRKGWPDISPLLAYGLAEEYRSHRARESPTDDLDAYLAHTPWRSVNHVKAWREAIHADKIPRPPWDIVLLSMPEEAHQALGTSVENAFVFREASQYLRAELAGLEVLEEEVIFRG